MDRPSDEVVDIESGHYTDKDVLHEDEREPLHDPESFDLDSLELQDLEKSEKHATSIQKPIDRLDSGINYRLILLIVVNTFATVGIVFTNKAIFEHHQFRHAQLTFAAFHFTLTGLTLYVMSRPFCGFFKCKMAPTFNILPLSIAMCLNVIVPNLSLAFSSVTFYQIARILLTPCVATLNYVISRTTIPRSAALTLVPVCIGVGIVSYYDRLPAPGIKVKPTTLLGVIFAFAGVFCSALYTVWIAVYHRTLEMNSMQLLLNQAPVSVLILAYIIPFGDDLTVWRATEVSTWLLVLLSGVFAFMINLSQLYIVNEAGPVSSTVVGHLKTCCIVALGWFFSGRSVRDWSVVGIVLAIGSIILYSVIMHKHSKKA